MMQMRSGPNDSSRTLSVQDPAICKGRRKCRTSCHPLGLCDAGDPLTRDDKML